MNYQELIDNFIKIACVISVSIKDGEPCGELCIEAANEAYLRSVQVDPADFVSGKPYHTYIGKEHNFEAMTLRCIREERMIHAYVDAVLYHAWLDIYLMPLKSDRKDRRFCLFSYEMEPKADADRLADVSPRIALQVLRTTIMLRETDDFDRAMDAIVESIRMDCGASSCRILLTDYEQRTCELLCESIGNPDVILPMSRYLDEHFFSVVETWDDLMAGSNCVVIHNEAELEHLKETCPVWYDSLKSANVKNIVLYPLRAYGETLGYIWMTNFDDEETLNIKATLEVTTFILASEISNHQFFNKMRHLSTTDLLTDVLNRNAMNNRITDITTGKSLWDRPYGVVFIDVNGLKVVNDRDGHLAGDHLLKSAAVMIKNVFHSHEIFRIGGDEFLVLVTDCERDEFQKFVDSIREASERSNTVKLAIGACYSDDNMDIRDAMHQADERMYRDKEAYYNRK